MNLTSILQNTQLLYQNPQDIEDQSFYQRDQAQIEEPSEDFEWSWSVAFQKRLESSEAVAQNVESQQEKVKDSGQDNSVPQDQQKEKENQKQAEPNSSYLQKLIELNRLNYQSNKGDKQLSSQKSTSQISIVSTNEKTKVECSEDNYQEEDTKSQFSIEEQAKILPSQPSVGATTIKRKNKNQQVKSKNGKKRKKAYSAQQAKAFQLRNQAMVYNKERKIEELRQMKHKKEISEVRQPEINKNSLKIIQGKRTGTVEERLINEGVKKKYNQEMKEKIKLQVLKFQSNPQITEKAQQQIRQGDQFQRLFQYQKIYDEKLKVLKQNTCQDDPELTLKPKICRGPKDPRPLTPQNVDLMKGFTQDNYDFKPKLSQNSLNMAKRLGSPMDRLTTRSQSVSIIKKDMSTFKPQINQISSQLDNFKEIRNSKGQIIPR